MDTHLLKRFWSRVDRSGHCWEWTADKFNNGYGRFYFEGRQQGAHRLAYELIIGTIPDGMCACHKCDNPSCVRPSHIFIGTQLENMRDAAKKGRTRGFQRGNKPSHALFTDDEVREIRWRIKNRGSQSLLSLATEMGINYQTMYAIKVRRNYAAVQ